MKFGTAIGIVISLVGIALGATMEGTQRHGRPQRPGDPRSCSSARSARRSRPAACRPTSGSRRSTRRRSCPTTSTSSARVNELVGYAEKARRDGLLALDEAVKEIADPFTRKGIQLVVDGTDPDLVAAVLDAENEAMRKRHGAAPRPVHAGRRASRRRWASSAPCSASST